MTGPTLDLSLPGDGELRSTVTGAGGIDPWAGQARIADARPVDIAEVASVFARSGAGMDQAYLSSGDAQTTLAVSFRNNGAPVLDRDGFYAQLPAGFRDSGTQLAEVSRSLHVVAQDLSTAMEQAGATVRGLVAELDGKRRDWHARVAAANPIPHDQVGTWLADRDTVAAGMASTVAVAGGAVGKVISAYEDSVHKAVRVLADHGHVPLEQVSSMAAPGAEYAGAVDPATLGTPAGAGTAADPVNTGTGNFVEIETDLEFGALVAGLSWTRVYNSRADAGGPFGPRWSSWASARLHDSPSGAEFLGPDGGRLFFPRDTDGFRSLHTDARVERDPVGLTLCWPDGRRWSFDTAGRPATTSSGPGTEVSFVHDEAGQLVELVHTGGRRVTVEWEHGLITAVACGDRRVEYRYAHGHLAWAGPRRYGTDVDGFLATVTDADGVVELVNTYDDAGRVTSQLTPFGRTVRFSYEPGGITVTSDDTGGPRNTFLHDTAGRLTGSIDGHGHTTRLRRDPNGRIVEITDRTGAVTTQEWDDRGRLVRRLPPTGVLERFSYDDLDRPVEVVVATSAATAFTYSGAERIPSQIVDPEGGVTQLHVVDGLVTDIIDADGVRIRLDHDADGGLISATDADGHTARLERDTHGRAVASVSPAGRRTTFTHDPHGRPVSRTDPDGALWRYEHTPGGRLAAVTDPLGARTEHHYGPHGERSTTVDALGAVTELTHDTFGNIAGVTAADGAKWAYGHDALMRLAAWTDPAGGTWLREYDPGGRLTASVDPDGVRATATLDPAGRVTGLHDGLTSAGFGYDTLGRATSHTRPDGATLTAAFDLCGRAVTRTDPAGGITHLDYTKAGRLRRIISPAGRVTNLRYDACGRAVERTDGAAGRWLERHDPDGLLVERTSAAGLVETFTHDPCGRVLTHTVPGLGVTTWTYDAAGRTVAVTDRAGHRTFTRDLAGRVTAATDALGHTTRYTRDLAGRIVAITDPLGAVWSRTHDANGRLATATDPLGHTTTYTYDGAGRLVERRDATGSVARYHHDTSGRVSAISGDPENPIDITIDRDTLGRPIRITEPGVPDIGLRYDRNGKLIERRSGDRTLRWTYDPDGLPTARTHNDGHTVARDHDGAGHTTALTHPLLGRVELDRDPDGRLIALRTAGVTRRWTRRDGLASTYQIGDQSTRLERDQHGRVTTIDDQHLTYDPAGQLTTAGDWTFRYDACGRLVRETGPGGRHRDLTYDPAGRLTRAGSQEFTSDAAGRRTGHGTYDALDRPTHIGTTPVTIDALGELVAAGDTPLLWDTTDPLSPLAQIGDRTVLGDTHPWAATNPDTWLAPDWQHSIGGSPSADPWGGAGPDLAPGYRGELAIDGHIWLRHRTYDPATRTFTTPDPWPAIPATAYAGNPYHYAGNDPINQIDPLGLRPITDADVQSQQDDGGILGWLDRNKNYIIGGTAIAAGVLLTATGVGAPAGIALAGMALGGALTAGGISTVVQQATTGTVDPNKVAFDTGIGLVTGGVGGAAGAGASRLLAATPLASTASNAIAGGISSAASGMTARGLTGTNPLDPQGLATDLLIGTGTGAIAGRLGGAAPAPSAFEPVPYIYRGVPYGHPGYAEATRGNAFPRGGDASVSDHTGGITHSNYTSWSRDPGVAFDASIEGNGPGAILRIPETAGPGYKVIRPESTPYEEYETVVEGPVRGADVFYSGPFGHEWGFHDTR